ncbi:MAG: hypothetical protein Q7S88_03255 [Candidatus Daviesbacteria bacterium]|nr:hypothetical protein [Candidatus Daviesbacteria bacterium]
MSATGERLMEGIVHGICLALDLTDHLEPRVTGVKDRVFKAHFNQVGWREVEVGPLSGSVIVHESRVEGTLEEIRGRHDSRPVFQIRQRVDDLLKGVGI